MGNTYKDNNGCTVDLGIYRGLRLAKDEITVTDDEVNEILEMERQKHAQKKAVEGRPVKSGDTVTISFKGFIDGEAFPGGTAEDYPLTVGSDSFIPGFEDQIIGQTSGVPFDVNVTFPEDYFSDQLAGKAAVFSCSISAIEEMFLPELNDEFAASFTDFKSIDEFKDDLKKNIGYAKNAKAGAHRVEKLIDMVIEDSEFDIPSERIVSETDLLFENYRLNSEQRGMSFEESLKSMNMTPDEFRKQIEPMALKSVQTGLILEAIAENECFLVTADDIEVAVNSISQQFGMPPEKIRSIIQTEMLVDEIKAKKARALILAESLE